MKRTVKRFATVDVRSLDQRETKINNRKGMLPAETEKKPVCAVVQLPLFGNPFDAPVNNPIPDLQSVDECLDSLIPDYVKHRKKYGYEVL